jgi:hypothetical protein
MPDRVFPKPKILFQKIELCFLKHCVFEVTRSEDSAVEKWLKIKLKVKTSMVLLKQSYDFLNNYFYLAEIL